MYRFVGNNVERVICTDSNIVNKIIVVLMTWLLQYGRFTATALCRNVDGKSVVERLIIEQNTIARLVARPNLLVSVAVSPKPAISRYCEWLVLLVFKSTYSTGFTEYKYRIIFCNYVAINIHVLYQKSKLPRT